MQPVQNELRTATGLFLQFHQLTPTKPEVVFAIGERNVPDPCVSHYETTRTISPSDCMETLFVARPPFAAPDSMLSTCM